jgi:hypothetical protein
LQSDAPWLLKRLEEERTRDRRSFQEVPPSELVHARRMLALEELKRVVVRSVTVSRAETNRLLDLVERTEWVEIVAATGRRDRVVRLQSGLRTDAPTALREARLLAAPSLSSERLDRSGLWPPGPGAEPHNFAMFLAIHANATSAGTVSAVFEAASQDGRRTWLLYIAARQTRKRAPGSGEQTTGRARAAIEHVKRVQRFELWLWDRIRERTTILVPRYQESIEPHEAAPLYEGKTGSPLGTVRGR